MDAKQMMQWFEGREPFKLECLQRQQHYHATYVGEYIFFLKKVMQYANCNMAQTEYKNK